MISIRAPIGALCWFPNGQLCTALCRQIAFLSSLAPMPWQTSLVSLRWKSVGSISHVCHRNVRNCEQAATGWPWSCACRNESNKNSMPATAFPALQNVHSHTHACHGIPSSAECPQSHSFSPLDKRWVIQWSCLVWDGYYRSWNTASEGRPEEGEVGRWHLLSQANRTKPNTLCDKPCLPLHLSTEKEPQRGKCTHLMTHS